MIDIPLKSRYKDLNRGVDFFVRIEVGDLREGRGLGPPHG